MNTQRKTTNREGGKLANANRHAAPRMASSRKISLAAGLLYVLTFVSIPTFSLYGQVKSANYITGAGPEIPSACLRRASN